MLEIPAAKHLKILAGILLVVGASIGACSSAPGVTPSCTYNVDENGLQAIDGGCEGFAVCKKAPSDPIQCCLDEEDKTLKGEALSACLSGYGVSSGAGGGGSGGTGGAATGGAGGAP